MKVLKRLLPPATIGLVGGGQLGRMFVFEAKRMGYHVIVLDPKPHSPAGQVADEQIIASFDDLEAYRRLAEKSQVITFEFEHIHAGILSQMEAEGHTVVPSAHALKAIQNKHEQKKMLERIGVPTPPFVEVSDYKTLKRDFDAFRQKAVIKSSTNGYDGKGNLVVKSEQDLIDAYKAIKGQGYYMEAFVDYQMEVSMVVVKSNIDLVCYPIAHNVHHDSILIKTSVPARVSNKVQEKIEEQAARIMEALDSQGVFCIEFFVDQKEDVLVNEIAPRPHNSGHYSIEASVCSQFEQQVRVVCGMPLGSPELIKPCVMYNVLGNESVSGEYHIDGLESLLAFSESYFHLYGKPHTDHLKKIGHLTVLGETLAIAEDKGQLVFSHIRIKEKSDHRRAI